MVEQLVFEYFCRPIIDNTVMGYNPVNTLAYGSLLFIIAACIILPFLRKNNVKVDLNFTLAILPYVVFGSSFRVLNDMGFFSKTCNPFDPNFYTFTPGIWFLTAGLTIAGLIIAKKISRKEEDFTRLFGAIGAIIALPAVVYELSVFTEWAVFLLVPAITIFVTLTVKKIVEAKYKGFFADKMDILMIAGQVLDGSATFAATDILSCGEQHPLSAGLLSLHPALFIIVKILIALLIIHAVKQEDERTRNFIKVAVIILGFATGTRDALTLGVGTCS